jgi:hypothetical protein
MGFSGLHRRPWSLQYQGLRVSPALHLQLVPLASAGIPRNTIVTVPLILEGTTPGFETKPTNTAPQPASPTTRATIIPSGTKRVILISHTKRKVPATGSHRTALQERVASVNPLGRVHYICETEVLVAPSLLLWRMRCLSSSCCFSNQPLGSAPGCRRTFFF